MKCDNCRCLVTQEEADEAAQIFPTEGTLCPDCADDLNYEARIELQDQMDAAFDNQYFGGGW